MADAISSLEARLASLEQNGFKLNPATANPGERGCREHLSWCSPCNSRRSAQAPAFVFGTLHGVVRTLPCCRGPEPDCHL